MDTSTTMEIATKRKRNPSIEDLNDPSKQAGYLLRFHDNPLKDNERLPLPILPKVFRLVPYPNYEAAVGLIDDAANFHLMLRIIGDPGSGKSRILLESKRRVKLKPTILECQNTAVTRNCYCWFHQPWVIIPMLPRAPSSWN